VLDDIYTTFLLGSNFIQILSVGAELFLADGQIDVRDKTNGHFSQYCGGEHHPQHTQTGSNSSTTAADSSNGVTNIRYCRYSCMRS
jgi:hypothetical protein